MRKKEKKFIALSEVDHKLQFISTVAVIGSITPTISRSKLSKVGLSLLDETTEQSGFNVRLKMGSETLNQFLNVAKRGFIIQLNEIKVEKNEGEVYGEVYEEEEITLYNDSPLAQKWYPQEKPTAVTDTIKSKIQALIKWKKENFKDIKVMPEERVDKAKTRRSGLGSDIKRQPASKVLNKINVNEGSTVSNNSSPKIKESNKKETNNLPLLKEKNSPTRKNKLETSVGKNKSRNRPRSNKLTSSEEEESSSTSLSRTSVSSTPSRIARANNLNKSLSLPNVTKLISSRTRHSSSLSSLNKLDSPKQKKSLSKLNKSEPQISLDNSKDSPKRKKVTRGSPETKEENLERESIKSKRLPQLESMSKGKKTKLSLDTDDENISERNSSETDISSVSSVNHQPDKKNNKNKDQGQVTKKRNSPASTSKDFSLVNTSIVSLRNKVENNNMVNESINKGKSKANKKSTDLKTEMKTPKLKNQEKNQTDSIIQTKSNIEDVKSNETNTSKSKKKNATRSDDKVGSTGVNDHKVNCASVKKSNNKESEKNAAIEEKINTSASFKRAHNELDEVKNTPVSLSKKKSKLDQECGVEKSKYLKKTATHKKGDLSSEIETVSKTHNQLLEKSTKKGGQRFRPYFLISPCPLAQARQDLDP